MSTPEDAFVTWISGAIKKVQQQFPNAILRDAVAEKLGQPSSKGARYLLDISARFAVGNGNDISVTEGGEGTDFRLSNPMKGITGVVNITDTTNLVSPSKVETFDTALKSYNKFRMYCIPGNPTSRPTSQPVYEFFNDKNVRIGANLYGAQDGKAYKAAT